MHTEGIKTRHLRYQQINYSQGKKENNKSNQQTNVATLQIHEKMALMYTFMMQHFFLLLLFWQQCRSSAYAGRGSEHLVGSAVIGGQVMGDVKD